MTNARSRRVALTTAIAMPWHTTRPSLRWIGSVVYLLLCIGAACALLIPGRHGWLYGMVVYCFGAASPGSLRQVCSGGWVGVAGGACGHGRISY